MKIVVYCSAAAGLPASWTDAATRVGFWAGLHGASLVYGGVDAGLMKTTALAAKKAGAKIVGVVPARRRNVESPLNDTTITVCDLNDRKATMQVLGDIFVVLPGGYGTLDEFASTFSYLSFTEQEKPIILCNSDGIYQPLLDQLDLMARTGLIAPGKLDKIMVADSTDDLETALDKAYTKISEKKAR